MNRRDLMRRLVAANDFVALHMAVVLSLPTTCTPSQAVAVTYFFNLLQGNPNGLFPHAEMSDTLQRLYQAQNALGYKLSEYIAWMQGLVNHPVTNERLRFDEMHQYLMALEQVSTEYDPLNIANQPDAFHADFFEHVLRFVSDVLDGADACHVASSGP